MPVTVTGFRPPRSRRRPASIGLTSGTEVASMRERGAGVRSFARSGESPRGERAVLSQPSGR